VSGGRPIGLASARLVGGPGTVNMQRSLRREVDARIDPLDQLEAQVRASCDRGKHHVRWALRSITRTASSRAKLRCQLLDVGALAAELRVIAASLEMSLQF